jgi:carboxyl-terminal processing protease
VKVFEEIWETIDEKYYDPKFNGVNWRAVRDRYRPLIEQAGTDDQFYTLLKQMVGELRDAHTRFHTPRERRERKDQQRVTVGVSIFEVEGQTVIVGVDPRSDAERLGVEPGMVVKSINGVPIAELLAAQKARLEPSSSERATGIRLYNRIIEGESGSQLRIALARSNGDQFDVTLTRRSVDDLPKVTWRRLPSGYGYMRLNIWKSPIHREFERALHRLRDAPGMIIDLRGNPGGEVDEVLDIAEHFFPERIPFGRFIARSGKTLKLFAGEDDDDDELYRGSLVVLINESSGSGSEMFAGVLQETGRARVIGRPSCGCLLGIARFREVKGGGELAISELAYQSPKGRILEGNGVIPDEQVNVTIADLVRKRDLTLESAESALRAGLKASTSVR